jgi:diguanylate cyclase (GGDEF)-like protein
MSTQGIALIAALGGLVLVAVLILLTRAVRRRGEDEVSRALAEMGDRMDELATQLGTAMDRVRTDGSRAQAVLDLSQSDDLEEILARTVEAAALVEGVDATLVRVEAPDGHSYVASSAIPLDLAEAQLLSGPPDARRVGAVRLSYLYRGDEPPGALRSGVAVPVEHDGRLLGFLAAYSFDRELDEEHVVGSLDTIAATAGAAISEALEASTARRLGPSTVDTLTGLGNRTGFHEVLARELARAHRFGRPLTVLLLDVDEFKALNAEIGHLGGDDVLRWTAARIRECAREADVACRIGSDEFAVILPDAGRVDAESTFARVQATLLRQPLEPAPSVTLSGGIAEAEGEDDALALYHRAEEALGRAKAAGRGTAA